MLGHVLTYLTEGFTYAGLEIYDVHGVERYCFLEVNKRKGELQITNKATLSSLSELKGHLKKDVPLFLSINTSKVLTKIVEDTETKNPEALVNNSFANLDLNNFYFEVIQMPQRPIIAISKKDYLNGIIQKLNELKIRIVHFSLGISILETITLYIQKRVISGSNFQIATENDLITKISPQPNEADIQYDMNGLTLSSIYILPFSNIIGNLIQKQGITNFREICTDLKWKFKNQRIFNCVLKFSLVFYIGLLLVNFLVFDHYHDKVEILSTAVAANSSQRENLANLEASVKKKKERVETLSTSSNSKSTYYLDKLAKNVPDDILLDEIKYQPLLKSVRDSKPIELEEHTILVSGISKDGKEFSLWLEKLEKQDWISMVETLDYDYISTETSNFSIKIGFHENK